MLTKTIKYLLALLAFILSLPVFYVLVLDVTFDPNELPEHYGNLDVELYADTQHKQPLLVYFGGSGGGNTMTKSSRAKEREMYTEEGYALMAVGYFGMDGLPKELDRISLNSIHTEIKRIQKLEHIDESCVAVMGASKGAELALALASKFSDINAVVSYAGSHVSFSSISVASGGRTGSYAYNDESLPFVEVPGEAVPHMLMGDFRTAHEIALEDKQAESDAFIEVENIKGPILLTSGEFDHVWPSAEMSAAIVARLEANDFQYPYQHIMVPNGDHFQPQKDHIPDAIAFLNTHFLPQCESYTFS